MFQVRTIPSQLSLMFDSLYSKAVIRFLRFVDGTNQISEMEIICSGNVHNPNKLFLQE